MARLVLLLRDRPGATVPVGDELTIGRAPDRDVTLDDPATSAWHARIERMDGEFQIEDLGSKNGTRLNGVRVERATLGHGDVIQIGRARLRFETEAGRAGDGERRASGLSSLFEADLQLPVAALENETVAAADGPRSLDPHPRQLGALYRLGKLARPERGVDAFLSALAELVLASVGGRRCLLLLEDDADPAALVLRASAGDGPDRPPALEPATLADAIERQQAILHRNPEASAGEPAAVLCAPFGSGPGTRGLVYLEAGERDAGLHVEELRLVAVMASQAGLILHSIRLHEELEARCAERSHRIEVQDRELRELRGELRARYRLGDLYGRAPAMQRVHELAERFARLEGTILLTGESGTGKEMLARAIHVHSPRAERPFVAVNCGALVPEIFESELFGHLKGSFTGAIHDKPGFFREAHGGTIFLDEVAEIAPSAQVKLLRVLQEREVVPVGSTRPVPVDLRIIAATNRDLAAAIADGGFREDLYYRLQVLTIHVPPLRERRADIAGLAARFVEDIARRLGQPAPRLAPDTLACLESHDWPGNVRELSNAIEYATAVCLGDTLEVDHLPASVRGASAASPGESSEEPSGYTLADLERAHILRVLAGLGGNRTEAARRLGIDRKTLYRKLVSYGIENEPTD